MMVDIEKKEVKHYNIEAEPGEIATLKEIKTDKITDENAIVIINSNNTVLTDDQ
jgi:hypothetical protein